MTRPDLSRAAVQQRRQALVRATEVALAEGLQGYDLAAATGRTWKNFREALKDAGRLDLIEGCGPPRRGVPYPSRQDRARREEALADLVEDVEWMLLSHECLTGAAHRLSAIARYPMGRTPGGLHAALHRAGRPDLARALRANEPVTLSGIPQQRREHEDSHETDTEATATEPPTCDI